MKRTSSGEQVNRRSGSARSNSPPHGPTTRAFREPAQRPPGYTTVKSGAFAIAPALTARS